MDAKNSRNRSMEEVVSTDMTAAVALERDAELMARGAGGGSTSFYTSPGKNRGTVIISCTGWC